MYLSKGQPLEQAPVGRGFKSSLGACVELGLFSLALLMSVPIPASDYKGHEVSMVGVFVFWMYCVVGWIRAGKGWRGGVKWACKGVVFLGFIMALGLTV